MNQLLLNVLNKKSELTAPQPNAEVAEAIHHLRRELAEELDRSLSWVFPQQTIDELALHQPRSLAALKDIHGLGSRRIRAYGQRILDAIDTALDG